MLHNIPRELIPHKICQFLELHDIAMMINVSKFICNMRNEMLASVTEYTLFHPNYIQKIVKYCPNITTLYDRCNYELNSKECIRMLSSLKITRYIGTEAKIGGAPRIKLILPHLIHIEVFFIEQYDLSECINLETVKYDQDSYVDAGSIYKLENLPRLKSVSGKVDDVSFLRLPYTDIAIFRNITDEYVTAICDSNKRHRIKSLFGLFDEDTNYDRFKELKLEELTAQNEFNNDLWKHMNIRRLRLIDSYVPPITITSIRELIISTESVDIKNLTSLVNLNLLVMHAHDIDNIDSLAVLPITVLDIEVYDAEYMDLSVLNSLPLKHLELKGCELRETALCNLPSTLTELTITNCRLRNTDLTKLPRKLTSFSLASSYKKYNFTLDLSDTNVKMLNLKFDISRLKPEILPMIRKLPLTKLAVTGCKIDDDMVDYFMIPTLQSLDVSHNRLTSSGIHKLKQLNIRYLRHDNVAYTLN